MGIEQSLWNAANQLRANSKLKASEYASPVLGLIFLKFADYKFTLLEKEFSSQPSKKRKISKEDYLAKGAIYLNDKARFKYLLQLPEGENIGQRINEGMKLIEDDNSDLKDTLPKVYSKLSNSLLVELLRHVDNISKHIEGDAIGKIYEYFLGKFAMSEGRKGGEFFTPTSLVKLIVEIIEPYEGRIYDPACGSGGMFVQSARFVKEHKSNPSKKISIYGQEKEEDTVKLNKMNLAVHGLAGDIKQGITYYEDLHNSISKFDYVMANPPFNVKEVDKEKIKDDPRFPFGIPSLDNANYLWMQIFYSALKENGKAGFIMANAATDARSSELEIRKKIIKANVVDVIISVGTNFFYTVVLPCTLWFFDKGKKSSKRKNEVLFINANEIYTQIDRAHREFTPQQIEFISNIVRLYKKKEIENIYESKGMILENFKKEEYKNIPGLCKVISISQIEKNNWSLNPGRYVGTFVKKKTKSNFHQKFKELNYKLSLLNNEGKEIEKNLNKSINLILKNKK